VEKTDKSAVKPQSNHSSAGHSVKRHLPELSTPQTFDLTAFIFYEQNVVAKAKLEKEKSNKQNQNTFAIASNSLITSLMC
jgi:hypothetical protein